MLKNPCRFRLMYVDWCKWWHRCLASNFIYYIVSPTAIQVLSNHFENDKNLFSFNISISNNVFLMRKYRQYLISILSLSIFLNNNRFCKWSLALRIKILELQYKDTSNLKHLAIAGALTGFVEYWVMYPLDLIKTET